MLPLSVTGRIQKIDALVPQMQALVNAASFATQSIYSNHLVLQAAGLVENGVCDILSHYAGNHGDTRLRRFVQAEISRNNSLNCEKIEKIIEKFDPSWIVSLKSTWTASERSAVDSLKAIRDQIAHGNSNGTGYATVAGYYNDAKAFITKVGNVILPTL